MNKKENNEVFWKMFEKSGNAGYYMLYKALNNNDRTKNIQK